MTVDELMEILEEMPAGATVRLASQPQYPFQHHLDGVVFVDPFQEDQEADASNWGLEHEEAQEGVVYLADGGQVRHAPLLPGYAREEIGW